MDSKKIILIAGTVFMLNCFSSEKSLPDVMGTAGISGRVVGPDGTPLPNVQVTTSHQGKTYQATSGSKGAFTVAVSDVERGAGLNLQFTRANFENAAAAAVISLPNLKTDIGDVVMYIVGGTDTAVRWITGQVLDNFSYKPLANANILTIDSAGLGVVATTDDQGRFELGSLYFALGSSFAVTAIKSNYITRSDLVAVITAEENPIKNSPIRLYQKFGAVHGYVQHLVPAAVGSTTMGHLDGVTATLTNSNNQVLNCVSGLGKSPAGPYDNVPLAIGAYCPNLNGIVSPFTIGGPVTNNSGGFKIQDDFLLLGNRYAITLAKSPAGCSTRTNGTTGCFRSTTTFADVLFTGNNQMAGGTKTLPWDAWIRGTVPAAGAGVTVKLYTSANQYLTETTTTGAAGDFRFEGTVINGNTRYKMTFEKVGYYSRLIGIPAPNNEVQIDVLLTGDNNAGAVTMTALPPPTHCVKGTVTNYVNSQAIPGAAVYIFDGGWRTAVTDGLGQFNIGGTFGQPAARNGDLTLGSSTVINSSTAGLILGSLVTGTGIAPGTTIATIVSGTSFTLSNAASTTSTQMLSFMPYYPVEISKADFTGESLVAKQTFSFAHNGIAACPGSPYDIDTAGPPLVGPTPCDATGIGPVGGTNCVARLVLHPIGIFPAPTAAGYQKQIKQTYEKFLTEKTGLTISARSGDILRVPAGALDTYGNVSAFYLHFDDTPKSLPNVPEGKWSNHVPVNPTSSSPTVNGVLVEGVGNDSRITPWEIKTYVYYHLYAAKLGSYVVETTGSTDTYITVIGQTGAVFGSDDDSGSGSNGRLTLNLSQGWYYIKVSNKGNNVFGFFDVQVTTGVTITDADYASMMSPIGPSYQTVAGTATYSTNCTAGNGNLVVSYYDASPPPGSKYMYIAAPGENGGCSASATIQKHGAVGEIIRGTFDVNLRPIHPTGINKTYPNGYFNIIRQE